MRYVRKKDGEFLRYSVELPFSDEAHSFPYNAPFEILKEAGYFKLIDAKPASDKKVSKVEIVQINDDEATLKFEYEEDKKQQLPSTVKKTRRRKNEANK